MDLEDVEECIERVRKQSKRLAEHYCENPNSFKMDEFLDSFREFCEKVKLCEQVIWHETITARVSPEIGLHDCSDVYFPDIEFFWTL